MNADLFGAIQAGDLAQLSALLAKEPALAAARNAEGVSAVLLSLYCGRAEATDLLLAARPPLDLFEAAALGRTSEAEAWLDREPALASSFSRDGFAPLHPLLT